MIRKRFESAAGIADVIAVERDYLVLVGLSLTVDAGTLAATRTRETAFSGGSVLATDGMTALLANVNGYARIVDAGAGTPTPGVG